MHSPSSTSLRNGTGGLVIIKLKLCPFCGGKGELVISNPWDPYEAHVRCAKCGIEGPRVWMVNDEKFKTTAVRLWNRRVKE